MKKHLASTALTVLKIWASVWLTFLISIVPLYILRGQSFESVERKIFYENLIMALVSIVVNFLILALLQRGTDRIERTSPKDTVLLAATAAGVYFFFSAMLWVIGRNNYIFAGCGYHLELLFGATAQERPTLRGMLLGSLVSGVGHFGALLLGAHLARRARERFLRKQ